MNRHKRRLLAAKRRKAQKAKREADPKRYRENVPETGLPERLYQAYGTSAEWKAYNGKNMPAWNDLPARIKKHWAAVAAECAKFTSEQVTGVIHELVKTAKGDPIEDAKRAAENEGVIEVVEIPKVVKP